MAFVTDDGGIMSEAEELGMEFRLKRTALRLDQCDVAERIGMAPQNLNRFEKGHFMPSIEKLRKLADVYNCDLKMSLAERKRRRKKAG